MKPKLSKIGEKCLHVSEKFSSSDDSGRDQGLSLKNYEKHSVGSLSENTDSTVTVLDKSKNMKSSDDTISDSQNLILPKPSFVIGGEISPHIDKDESKCEFKLLTEEKIPDLQSVSSKTSQEREDSLTSAVSIESTHAPESSECFTPHSLVSLSSVNSSKKLEWDSGADLGYKKKAAKSSALISTLERMAIENYTSALPTNSEKSGSDKNLKLSSKINKKKVKTKSVLSDKIVPQLEHKAWPKDKHLNFKFKENISPIHNFVKKKFKKGSVHMSGQGPHKAYLSHDEYINSSPFFQKERTCSLSDLRCSETHPLIKSQSHNLSEANLQKHNMFQKQQMLLESCISLPTYEQKKLKTRDRKVLQSSQSLDLDFATSDGNIDSSKSIEFPFYKESVESIKLKPNPSNTNKKSVQATTNQIDVKSLTSMNNVLYYLSQKLRSYTDNLMSTTDVKKSDDYKKLNEYINFIGKPSSTENEVKLKQNVADLITKMLGDIKQDEKQNFEFNSFSFSSLEELDLKIRKDSRSFEIMSPHQEKENVSELASKPLSFYMSTSQESESSLMGKSSSKMLDNNDINLKLTKHFTRAKLPKYNPNIQPSSTDSDDYKRTMSGSTNFKAFHADMLALDKCSNPKFPYGSNRRLYQDKQGMYHVAQQPPGFSSYMDRSDTSSDNDRDPSPQELEDHAEQSERNTPDSVPPEPRRAWTSTDGSESAYETIRERDRNVHEALASSFEFYSTSPRELVPGILVDAQTPPLQHETENANVYAQPNQPEEHFLTINSENFAPTHSGSSKSPRNRERFALTHFGSSKSHRNREHFAPTHLGSSKSPRNRESFASTRPESSESPQDRVAQSPKKRYKSYRNRTQFSESNSEVMEKSRPTIFEVRRDKYVRRMKHYIDTLEKLENALLGFEDGCGKESYKSTSNSMEMSEIDLVPGQKKQWIKKDEFIISPRKYTAKSDFPKPRKLKLERSHYNSPRKFKDDRDRKIYYDEDEFVSPRKRRSKTEPQYRDIILRNRSVDADRSREVDRDTDSSYSLHKISSVEKFIERKEKEYRHISLKSKNKQKLLVEEKESKRRESGNYISEESLAMDKCESSSTHSTSNENYLTNDLDFASYQKIIHFVLNKHKKLLSVNPIEDLKKIVENKESNVKENKGPMPTVEKNNTSLVGNNNQNEHSIVGKTAQYRVKKYAELNTDREFVFGRDLQQERLIDSNADSDEPQKTSTLRKDRVIGKTKIPAKFETRFKTIEQINKLPKFNIEDENVEKDFESLKLDESDEISAVKADENEKISNGTSPKIQLEDSGSEIPQFDFSVGEKLEQDGNFKVMDQKLDEYNSSSGNFQSDEISIPIRDNTSSLGSQSCESSRLVSSGAIDSDFAEYQMVRPHFKYKKPTPQSYVDSYKQNKAPSRRNVRDYVEDENFRCEFNSVGVQTTFRKEKQEKENRSSSISDGNERRIFEEQRNDKISTDEKREEEIPRESVNKPLAGFQENKEKSIEYYVKNIEKSPRKENKSEKESPKRIKEKTDKVSKSAQNEKIENDTSLQGDAVLFSPKVLQSIENSRTLQQDILDIFDSEDVSGPVVQSSTLDHLATKIKYNAEKINAALTSYNRKVNSSRDLSSSFNSNVNNQNRRSSQGKSRENQLDFFGLRSDENLRAPNFKFFDYAFDVPDVNTDKIRESIESSDFSSKENQTQESENIVVSEAVAYKLPLTVLQKSQKLPKSKYIFKKSQTSKISTHYATGSQKYQSSLKQSQTSLQHSYSSLQQSYTSPEKRLETIQTDSGRIQITKNRKSLKFTIPCRRKGSRDPRYWRKKSLVDELIEINKENEIMTLQEALNLARPKYVEEAERRRMKIGRKITTRRLLQNKNRDALVQLPDEVRTPSVLKKFVHKTNESPLFSYKEIRAQTQKLYKRLPEAHAPVARKRKIAMRKTNRTMANFYSQRLKTHVLKGKISHDHRQVFTPTG